MFAGNGRGGKIATRRTKGILLATGCPSCVHVLVPFTHLKLVQVNMASLGRASIERVTHFITMRYTFHIPTIKHGDHIDIVTVFIFPLYKIVRACWLSPSVFEWNCVCSVSLNLFFFWWIHCIRACPEIFDLLPILYMCLLPFSNRQTNIVISVPLLLIV